MQSHPQNSHLESKSICARPSFQDARYTKAGVLFSTLQSSNLDQNNMIEDVQRSFTTRTSGMEGENYWERHQALQFIINAAARPIRSSIPLEIAGKPGPESQQTAGNQAHPRKGRYVTIPPIPTAVNESGRTAKFCRGELGSRTRAIID